MKRLLEFFLCMPDSEVLTLKMTVAKLDQLLKNDN